MRALLLGHSSFYGGAYLPMDASTAEMPVRDLSALRSLIVPLAHDGGPSARPAVEPGQSIEPGKLIGRPDGTGSVTVHAPLAGRAVDITTVDLAEATDVPAVHIEARDASIMSMPAAVTENESPVEENPLGPWKKHKLADRSLVELADLADRSGLIDRTPRGAGLGTVLREAAELHVQDVIINGLQSEPLITVPVQLLHYHLEPILAAGLIARDALSAKRIWLTLDAADRSFVRRCRRATAGTPIRVQPLDNKYPQATAPLLTWTATGRETPYGLRPVNVGVLVLSPDTLADLWAALHDGSPLTHCVITVAGPAARRPGHYRVPIGTRYADIIDGVGLNHPLARLIDGGPLTGRSIESLEAVIGKRTTAILLIDRESDHIPSPGPCIRCGSCQEDCPVGLDPQKLLDLLECDRPEEAARFYPHACIDCGLCSYICPAELPLAEGVARLKRLVPVK